MPIVGEQAASVYVGKIPEVVWDSIKKSIKERPDLTAKQVAEVVEEAPAVEEVEEVDPVCWVR